MTKFSEAFKKIRESKGYTQAKVADDLKISRSTVSMYESGLREPDYETLEDIADYFNVDMNYLLGLTNTTTKLRVPGQINLFEFADSTREQDLKIARSLNKGKNDASIGLLNHLEPAKPKETEFDNNQQKSLLNSQEIIELIKLFESASPEARELAIGTLRLGKKQ